MLRNIMKTLIFMILLASPYMCLTAGHHPSLEKMSLAEYWELPLEATNSLPAIATQKFIIEKARSEPGGFKGFQSLESFIMQIEDYLYDLRFYPYLPQGRENPALTAAIKDFQKSIGAAQTGILLMKELVELEKRVSLYHLPRFSALNHLHIHLQGNRIFVKGTWILVGEETKEEKFVLHSNKYILKIPRFNISTITCGKKAMLCREVIAQLDYDENSPLCWLEDRKNQYDIIKWSETEIIAEQELNFGYHITLIINIPSKNIHRITHNVSTETKNKKNDSPRIEKLVSSSEIFNLYGKKISDIKTTSPAYQDIKASINPD